MDVVYLLDPLLATGNTALAGIQMLEDWGLQQNQIKLLTIIGSRAAVDQISAGKPGVQVSIYYETDSLRLSRLSPVLSTRN